MNEGAVHQHAAFPADDQPTEVPQPGERALHDPSSAIAPELPPILGRGFHAARAVGDDQVDAALSQAATQRIAVIGLIRDHARGLLAGTPPACPRDRDRRERRFEEPDFRGEAASK